MCKFLKKVIKKFGSLYKSRTFAILSGNVVSEGMSSYEDCGIFKNLKNFSKKFGSSEIMLTFAAPFRKRVLERGFWKFIEKTDYCTRSKYREKYNLSRSVNSFERIKSVRAD